MNKSIAQIIADDKELSKLLLDIFKLRGHKQYYRSLDIKVCELADVIYTKYNIDLMMYT